jgi:hypothetical protein
MELVLRKASRSSSQRLRKATCLSLRARQLVFLAPCSGQWIFFSLVAPGSSAVLYNCQPAPPRCRVKVGDLLGFEGLELVVDAVTADPGEVVGMGDHLPVCDVEAPGQPPVQVAGDTWIGWDAPKGLSLSSTIGPQPVSVLLMFFAGRWYLHDLQGSPLRHNGAAASSSLILADGDRVILGQEELRFHLHCLKKQPAPEREAPVVEEPLDAVGQRARVFCQRLLATLRGEQKTVPARTGFLRGLWAWLWLLWPARSPEETLDRLEFLLAGRPRDRGWLFELARFLYQQSHWDLSLQVLRELHRLYPRDGEVVQVWVKLCYQLGCSAELPPLRRLAVLEKAEKGTVLARLGSPDNPVLTDLLQAVRAERTLLRDRMAQETASLHKEITSAIQRRP